MSEDGSGTMSARISAQSLITISQSCFTQSIEDGSGIVSIWTQELSDLVVPEKTVE